MEVYANQCFTGRTSAGYNASVDQVFAWTEADVLRKLRAETGITLKRLAKESGVAVKTINRLEMGHTQDAKSATIGKIARVFGMSHEEFFLAVPRRHAGPHVRVPDVKVAKWREERKRPPRRRQVVGGTR